MSATIRCTLRPTARACASSCQLNQAGSNRFTVPAWLILDTTRIGKPTLPCPANPEPSARCSPADCLPVLFCDRAGSVVAAAHAGWRGLAGGILEATVAAMPVPPGDILAWMGAAIGPQAFEVGDDVRDVFIAQHPETDAAFTPHGPGKWLADIYRLARIRLNRVGVQAIYGGGRCTFSESEIFFSYRRDGVTGRMASLIWLD